MRGVGGGSCLTRPSVVAPDHKRYISCRSQIFARGGGVRGKFCCPRPCTEATNEGMHLLKLLPTPMVKIWPGVSAFFTRHEMEWGSHCAGAPEWIGVASWGEGRRNLARGTPLFGSVCGDAETNLVTDSPPWGGRRGGGCPYYYLGKVLASFLVI